MQFLNKWSIADLSQTKDLPRTRQVITYSDELRKEGIREHSSINHGFNPSHPTFSTGIIWKITEQLCPLENL